ncbi:MAG: aspartate carbamoyltransferase regulatory subunit [Candidatus Hadarchaeia archaeon]
MTTEKLRVRKIDKGTVIDHINSGRALTVLKILGVTERTDQPVSVLMNVPSSKFGKKDIVKIEDRKVEKEEINKIALTAPEATINVIENYEVVEKKEVEFPERIEGVVDCSNPECITNTSEPVNSKFKVVDESPVRLRCDYCDRITEESEIIDQFRE